VLLLAGHMSRLAGADVGRHPTQGTCRQTTPVSACNDTYVCCACCGLCLLWGCLHHTPQTHSQNTCPVVSCSRTLSNYRHEIPFCYSLTWACCVSLKYTCMYRARNHFAPGCRGPCCITQ
jgi:hypothetical protein